MCSLAPLASRAAELTATREEVPEWQSAALAALVSASGGGDAPAAMRSLCAVVGACGTQGLGPHPLLLTAIGEIASAQWDAAAEAVAPALRVLAPLLAAAAPTDPAAGALSEPLRAALANAYGLLADSLRACWSHQAAVCEPGGPSATTSEAAALLHAAFEALRAPSWLTDSDRRPRHAALLAVGSLSSLLPPSALAAALPTFHPALLLALKREKDDAQRLPAAACLARVLEAAALADALEPHVAAASVSAAIAAIGTGEPDYSCASEQVHCADAARMHAAMLRCVAASAQARPAEALAALLRALDGGEGGRAGRCGALSALRHVACAAPRSLAPRADAVLSALRAAAGERDGRTRKALAQATLALAPLGYLSHGVAGGADLVLFLVRCAAITDAECAAYKEAALRRTPPPDAVSPDELRALGERALVLLGSTLLEAEPALWPALLSCICAASLSGALPSVCRACSDIMRRRGERGESLGIIWSQIASAQQAVATPMPMPSAAAVLARALVMLHAPHRRGSPGARLLELLAPLAPALHPSLGKLWAGSDGQLARLSAQLDAAPAASWRGTDAAAWDAALLKFTQHTLQAATSSPGGGSDAFAAALCDALADQRAWYAGDSQLAGAACAQAGAAAACLSRTADASQRLDALWQGAALGSADERRGVAAACGAMAATHPTAVLSKLKALSDGARRAAQPPSRAPRTLAALFGAAGSPAKAAAAASAASAASAAHVEDNAPGGLPAPAQTSERESPQERIAAVGLAFGAAARGMAPAALIGGALDTGVVGPLLSLLPAASAHAARAALARGAHGAAAAALTHREAAVAMPRRDELLAAVLTLVDELKDEGASDDVDTSQALVTHPGSLMASPPGWPDGGAAAVAAAALPAAASLLQLCPEAPPVLRRRALHLALRALGLPESTPRERLSAMRAGAGAVLGALLSGGDGADAASAASTAAFADTLASLLSALETAAACREVPAAPRAACLRAARDLLRQAAAAQPRRRTHRAALRAGERLAWLLPALAHAHAEVAAAAAEACGALLGLAAAAAAAADQASSPPSCDDQPHASPAHAAALRGALARCATTPCAGDPEAHDVALRLAVARVGDSLAASEVAAFLCAAPRAFTACDACERAATSAVRQLAASRSKDVWRSCGGGAAAGAAARACLRAAAAQQQQPRCAAELLRAAAALAACAAPADDPSCLSALTDVAQETAPKAQRDAAAAFADEPGLMPRLLAHLAGCIAPGGGGGLGLEREVGVRALSLALLAPGAGPALEAAPRLAGALAARLLARVGALRDPQPALSRADALSALLSAPSATPATPPSSHDCGCPADELLAALRALACATAHEPLALSLEEEASRVRATSDAEAGLTCVGALASALAATQGAALTEELEPLIADAAADASPRPAASEGECLAATAALGAVGAHTGGALRRRIAAALAHAARTAPAPSVRRAALQGLSALSQAKEEDVGDAPSASLLVRVAEASLSDADEGVVTCAAEVLRDALASGGADGARSQTLLQLLAQHAVCRSAPASVRVGATAALTALLAGGRAQLSAPQAVTLLPALLLACGARHAPLRNASLTALRCAAGCAATEAAAPELRGALAAAGNEQEALGRALAHALRASHPHGFHAALEWACAALRECQGEADEVAAACAAAWLAALLGAMAGAERPQEALAALVAATGPAASPLLRVRALAGLAGLAA